MVCQHRTDRLRSPPPVTDVSAHSAHSAGRTAGPGRSGPIIVALLVAGVLISAFSMLNGIDPFDEGITLQAARRITEGQLPYRDFLWAYGPAQPYLLAGLFKLFGTSLLQWRIVRVLVDSAIALVSYIIVRRRAGEPAALAVWLAVACEISEPRSADPFPPALLVILLVIAIAAGGPPSGRRVSWAAGLCALGAAFRLDFAVYALVAGCVAFAAGDHRESRLGLRAAPLQAALRFAALAALLTAAVYAPLAIVVGPGRLYSALVGNSLHTRGYWTLPFPLHFHAPPGAGVAKTMKKALDFYVPLLVIAGFVAAAAAALAIWWRERRPPAELLALAVGGIGLAAYLVSRSDEFHVQPLFVLVAISLGLIIGRARRTPRAARWSPRPSRPVLRFLALGPAVGLLALLLLHGVANRASALVHPQPATALAIPVADGVQAPPAEAHAIDSLVGIVDRLVPPADPIYVIPRTPDLVRYDDPLIYVLTQRRNPTPEDFGLLTGAGAQARIVDELRRAHPRVIVRWTDPISSSKEPNLRGRSTGVHTLDRWVAGHYRLLTRLYHYDVLVVRAAAPRPARS
jgi:hypothetical protein